MNNWIDDLNKKLEEQRKKFRETDPDEINRRKKSYAGKVTKQTDAGKKQEEDWRMSSVERRKKNPKLAKDIAMKAADTSRKKGHYDKGGAVSEAAKRTQANKSSEEKRANIDKVNMTLTKEDREKAAKKQKDTNLNKRKERAILIYETIKETDWFDANEVLEKYKFQSDRKNREIIGVKMFKSILGNNPDLFENKIVLNGGRKLMFRKVIDIKK
jgi:hypothetical protein